jgi:uncharacterized membrane protein YfcA
MELYLLTIIFIIGFFCAFVDCATGMGYGTLMSPILILFQFSISSIVPVLLLSQMCTGVFASLFHHKAENVNFNLKSPETKVALLFTLMGTITTFLAIFVVISIPNLFIVLYIGFVVLSMGVLLLLNIKLKFSIKHLYVIGGISAFNKALSGGGFGPLVTSRQVMSGVELKSAVAITTFSETILSLLGLILYVIFTGSFHIGLALIVLISGILATPFGVQGAKRLNDKKDPKRILGLVILILGSLTLAKCFLGNC